MNSYIRYYEKIGNSEPKCIEDELPFEIPNSWRWIRHNEIFEVSGGSQPPKSKFITSPQSGYIRLYQIRDYGKNPQPIFIPLNTASKISHKGEILLARYGASLGKVFWAEDGAYNVAMAKVIPLFDTCLICINYLFYYYKSSLYQETILGNARSAQAGFNKEDLAKMFFPLPPLSEQKRIVAEMERYEPLLAEYDKLEQQKSTLYNDIYDRLKKSILQYAIQGKLVPQNPNDEPASELLKRIRAEKKAQLGKKYIDSYIYKGDDNCYYEHINGTRIDISDNIPFEIPETWEWIRLPYIAINDLGKTLNSEKDSGESVPYLCSINVYWDGIKINKIKTALFSNDEKSKYKLEHGDLLICEGGEAGRCAVWEGNATMFYQNALHRVRFDKNIIPYFYKVVIEAYYHSGIINNYCKGVTIKHLVQSSLTSIYLPLPPLAEQRRIVNKLNEIFAKI